MVLTRYWGFIRSAATGPLGRYSLMMFIALRVGDAAMLVSKVFLGRYLPNFAFGAVEPFLSVLAILVLPIAIVCQSAVKTISRLTARGEEARCRAFMRDLVLLGLAVSSLTCAAVFAFRNLILTRLHLESSPHPMIYVSIMAALAAFTVWPIIATSIFQGMQKYKLLSLLSASIPILNVVLIFLLVGPLDLGLPGALAARTGAGVICAILVLFSAVSLLRGPKESYATEFKEFISTLLPMTIVTVCSTLLFHFDRLFVRNFRIDDSAGYGAIITLGPVPLWLIGPLAFVLFPLASADHALGKELSRMLRKAVLVAGLTTAACSALFWLAGEPILRAWKPEFAPYSRYLWIYSLAMGIDGMIQLQVNADMARHRYRGLWGMVVFAPLACAVIYAFRSWISITQMLSILVLARILILVGMAGLLTTVRAQVRPVQSQ